MAKPPPIHHATARAFRRRLLRWYDQHKRELPWRAVPPARANPYHVLVSEAMLQQTQVATVIAYFQRFIAAYPTLGDLAAAEEQQVLHLWQGLGYYRRARHLHAAARRIVADHAGRIPRTAPSLMTLPGVGRYSAGAVASIAFNQPEPVLDGNVARVLARHRALDQPIDDNATRKQLWFTAQQLLDPHRPGDFNQALMELGALRCLPRKPDCAACPLARSCLAHQRGLSHSLPVRRPRSTPRPVVHAVAAIQRNGRWLFHQRPDVGLWASLWQLPTLEADNQDITHHSLARWVQEQFGLAVTHHGQLAAFKHQTTHRTIQFTAHHFAVRSGRLRPGRGAFRPLNAAGDLPMANPHRQLLRMLRPNARD